MIDRETRAALEAAHTHTLSWLDSLDDRPVTSRHDVDSVTKALGDLPEAPGDPAATVNLLARAAEPGLTGSPSGRWFGFVVGGSLPAALGADWLTSAWDQNAGLRVLTPGTAAAEEVAGRWLLDLLGLPEGCGFGFTTAATTANLTGLAAGRDALLRRAGWDPAEGLAGGPALRVLAGSEVHVSARLAMRYLGLGEPELLAADDQSRVRPAALAAALAEEPDRPTLIALQAGDIHSGASDPFSELIPVAHAHGAWVHVDGAFGLWQAASPAYRQLCDGVDLADSWATDAHKTLNVPYDCGVAIVRDPAAMRSAMGTHAAYLIADAAGDQYEHVPEMSRRARGVPVWAALHSLGRSGVADLVDRLCLRAQQLAVGAEEIPGATVVNEVVFTQVCVSFGDDERTLAVVQRLLEDGVAWMSGSRWRDQAVLRISVSNWRTSEDDVARSLDALRRAAL